MKKRDHFILNNESGAALVVALLMIVILSLIGIASSSNSTFEIRLSGNKRGATDAFFTADAALVSVKANSENFNASYDDQQRVFKADWEPVTQADFDSKPFLFSRQELKTEFTNEMRMTSSTPSFSLPEGTSFGEQPEVIRMIVDRSSAPRGLGMSALAFKYNYYIINSIGHDQLDFSSVKSSCEIREKIVRLIPTGS